MRHSPKMKPRAFNLPSNPAFIQFDASFEKDIDAPLSLFLDEDQQTSTLDLPAAGLFFTINAPSTSPKVRATTDVLLGPSALQTTTPTSSDHSSHADPPRQDILARVANFVAKVKQLHFTDEDLRRHLRAPPTTFSMMQLWSALEMVGPSATTDVLDVIEDSSCADVAAQDALINFVDLAFLHFLLSLHENSSALTPADTADTDLDPETVKHLKFLPLCLRCPRNKNGHRGRTDEEARVWFARKLFVLSLPSQADSSVCVDVTLACDVDLAPHLRHEAYILGLRVQFWCFMAQKHYDPEFLELADALMARFDSKFPRDDEVRALHISARSLLDLELILSAPSLQGDHLGCLEHLERNLLSLVGQLGVCHQSLSQTAVCAHVALVTLEMLDAATRVGGNTAATARQRYGHLKTIIREFYTTLRKGFCLHPDFWCIRFELALALADDYAPNLSNAEQDSQLAAKMRSRLPDHVLGDMAVKLLIPPDVRLCLARHAHQRRLMTRPGLSLKSSIRAVNDAVEKKVWNPSAVSFASHLWFSPSHYELAFIARRTRDRLLPLIEQMFAQEQQTTETSGEVFVSMHPELEAAMKRHHEFISMARITSDYDRLIDSYKLFSRSAEF
eukprot:m.238640 g.238640  ORF g.238640 m.238640 type:complete len:618 (-) comp13333_c0_seq1:45-1898(-)